MKVIIFWLQPVTFCLLFCGPSQAEEHRTITPLAVEVVCVDKKASGYATFQSHNQKVVSNRYGIFMTYNHSRNVSYTAQTWRLLHSIDGGLSFRILYEDTHATNPPAIETDTSGNIYLVRSDFETGDAFLYRFLAAKGFQNPVISPIPSGGAGKYAMVIDCKRKRLYYFAHNNTFSTIDLSGEIIRNSTLLKPGPNAVLQYPLLNLDNRGRLHAAWTTLKRDQHLYWDIHHMISPDGGVTWETIRGTPLITPVTADQSGQATLISDKNEFEVSTWLANFLSKDGKLHFMYMVETNPAGQHYVRYDIASGSRDMDRTPIFRGENISLLTLDGFFAASAHQEGTPLYCVGKDERGHIACLISYDNGTTWNDFAKSRKMYNAYAIGGCRMTAKDGYIIGSFTDRIGSSPEEKNVSAVFFFRIRVPGETCGSLPRISHET